MGDMTGRSVTGTGVGRRLFALSFAKSIGSRSDIPNPHNVNCGIGIFSLRFLDHLTLCVARNDSPFATFMLRAKTAAGTGFNKDRSFRHLAIIPYR